MENQVCSKAVTLLCYVSCSGTPKDLSVHPFWRGLSEPEQENQPGAVIRPLAEEWTPLVFCPICPCTLDKEKILTERTLAMKIKLQGNFLRVTAILLTSDLYKDLN